MLAPLLWNHFPSSIREALSLSLDLNLSSLLLPIVNPMALEWCVEVQHSLTAEPLVEKAAFRVAFLRLACQLV